MNLYETVGLIRNKLEEGKDNLNDLLFGYNIVVDPYLDLSKLVPLILIEGDRTEYITSEYGDPAALEQNLSLTIFESAQKESYENYKSKIYGTEKKLIKKLMTIDDIMVRRIVPGESTQSEIMLGSLKATGIVLGIKIRTNWED